MRWAVSFALIALAQAQPAVRKPPKLPHAVQQVVDLAMTAPAEFAADAILRLLASRSIADADARREYAELAFRLAARSARPYRSRLLVGIAADTDAGYRAGAAQLGLDALSLETRAVTAALEIDPKLARELFAQIRRDPLEPLTCKAQLIPDLSAYYELVPRMAQLLKAAERQRGEQAAFFQVQIEHITSHSELAPAAQAIASVPWTSSEFEVVAGAFLSRMQLLKPDDRAFAASLHSINDAIAALQASARQNHANPVHIAQDYRAYLVTNFKAPRCTDDSAGRLRQVFGDTDEVFGPAIRGELAALTPEETRAVKVESGAEQQPLWQSEASKRIFAQCLSLRRGHDGITLSAEARATREWKRELSDLLSALRDWGATSEENETIYFREKAVVFQALIELAPGGEEREHVVAAYIDFLKSSGIQQNDPVEWYSQARSTLQRLRPTQPSKAARLEAMYSASGNAILRLEAALDALAPDYSLFQK